MVSQMKRTSLCFQRMLKVLCVWFLSRTDGGSGRRRADGADGDAQMERATSKSSAIKVDCSGFERSESISWMFDVQRVFLAGQCFGSSMFDIRVDKFGDYFSVVGCSTRQVSYFVCDILTFPHAYVPVLSIQSLAAQPSNVYREITAPLHR